MRQNGLTFELIESGSKVAGSQPLRESKQPPRKDYVWFMLRSVEASKPLFEANSGYPFLVPSIMYISNG